MRFILIILAVLAPAYPAAAGDCTGSRCEAQRLWIGTQGSGAGQGVFTATLNTKTGALGGLRLAAETDRPTWIVRDPRRPILYTVSETGNDSKQGGVLSFAIGADGALDALSRVPSGGAGPTYLGLDAHAKTLFVANFGSGQVSAVPVASDGRLADPVSVQADSGSGPHRRQKGPHPHSAVVDPSGRFVLVPDLGADRVFVYQVDRATRRLSPAGTPFLALPAGSGPRHLVFARHGQTAFLITELTAQIFVLGWDVGAGSLTVRSSVALDPVDAPGTRSGSEIALSKDGRFLYVSNRRDDTIKVYAVEARDKALSEVQDIASGGHLPWSFAFDPNERWLIVAHQGSDTLTALRRDQRTGKLSPADSVLTVPKPVHVAFE